MNKVLFILGPTGVGKSEVAIKLAQMFDGEIISADSVQVFRGLDIGSAKVSKKEQEMVRHHAIDILNPNERFSVFDYVKLTKQLIDEISSRGKLPIIVGGTALYVKALTEGFDFGGDGENTELRKNLEKLSEQELVEKLKELAPEKVDEIDLKNKRRLIRAVQIAIEGKSVAKEKPNMQFLVLALTCPREQLYEKINLRVGKMMESGLVDEVKRLKRQGLTKADQSMSAIGYKEILSYLDGEINLDEAVNLIKQHTRNYAKRQMTFIRSLNCHQVLRSDESKIISLVEEFYDNK